MTWHLFLSTLSRTLPSRMNQRYIRTSRCQYLLLSQDFCLHLWLYLLPIKLPFSKIFKYNCFCTLYRSSIVKYHFLCFLVLTSVLYNSNSIYFSWYDKNELFFWSNTDTCLSTNFTTHQRFLVIGENWWLDISSGEWVQCNSLYLYSLHTIYFSTVKKYLVYFS